MSPRRRPAADQSPLEGFPPPAHVTFTGTATDLDGLDVELGQEVEVTMKGFVSMAGTELIGDAGQTRPVVKIKAAAVTVR